MMTHEPVSRAGPILFMEIARGKFHGQIAPTTPRGDQRCINLRFSSSAIISSSKGGWVAVFC